MATIPRGIQVVEHTNADNSITKKYRVRIVRKGFKADRRFDDLQEASEFLNLSKLKKGKEIIFNITEEERLKKHQQEEDPYNYTFGYFVNRYINEEVLSKPITTEMQKRNRTNILSFYKTILNTSIENTGLTYKEKEEELGGLGDKKVHTFMKGFDIRKISNVDINSYIKERLAKGLKKSSVGREITHISNVFNNLQNISTELASLPNPCLKYNKNLLKDRTTKKKIKITKEEEELIFKKLQEKNNKAMYQIAMISALTALRRSEIIYLTTHQIHDNYIELETTKTTPRTVYIDKQAKDFLNTLKPVTSDGRLFSHTVMGFEGNFRRFLDDNKLQGRFSFHDLRRLAISRKIAQIGAENSVFITEFLGISNVNKFEELHNPKLIYAPTTQATALKNFGHTLPQTTKIYFNMPNIEIKKKP